MTSARSDAGSGGGAGLAWPLAGAAIVTSVTLGLTRYAITTTGSGFESASQNVAALITWFTVFALGGIPAVAATRYMARTRRVTSVRLAAAFALVGNLPSGVLGLGVLRPLIWDAQAWILTTIAAYIVGSATFLVVLLVAHRRRRWGASADTRP